MSYQFIEKIKSLISKRPDSKFPDANKVSSFLHFFYTYGSGREYADVVKELSSDIVQNFKKYEKELIAISNYLSDYELTFQAALKDDAKVLMDKLILDLRVKKRLSKLSKI